MNVQFFKTSSPPNKISKNLTHKVEITDVRFIENGSLDILNPSILINYSADIGDISVFNYLRIPKFNRYYFIESISTEGGLIRIDARCDVLMSHKTDILNSTQYILRSETLRSPYLVDNEIPIRSDKKLHQVVFGNNVDDKQCPYIILETTGKGGKPV